MYNDNIVIDKYNEHLRKLSKINTIRTTTTKLFSLVDRLHNSGINITEIGVDGWKQTDGNVPIINTRAGPCTILYFRNMVSGQIISGHFSNLNKLLGLSEDTHQKNLGKLMGGQFLEMINRIAEWTRMSGGKNVEMYLFGQNQPSSLFAISYNLDREPPLAYQNAVKLFFISLGLLEGQIFDHRVPGIKKVDDTVYIPNDSAIYHSTS